MTNKNKITIKINKNKNKNKNKLKNKNKNKNKINNNRISVIRLYPMSTSYTNRNGKQRVSLNGKIFTVHHREYIGTVVGKMNMSSTGEMDYYTNSPKMLWLKLYGTLFEMWKPVKTTYTYLPSCPTTTKGKVYAFFDYHITDEKPDMLSDLMNMANSVSTNAFNPMTLTLDNSRIAGRNNGWFFTSDTDSLNIDNSPGFFFITSNGLDDTSTIGEVFIEYTIQFKTPQIRTLMPATTGNNLRLTQRCLDGTTSTLVASLQGTITKIKNKLGLFVASAMMNGSAVPMEIAAVMTLLNIASKSKSNSLSPTDAIGSTKGLWIRARSVYPTGGTAVSTEQTQIYFNLTTSTNVTLYSYDNQQPIIMLPNYAVSSANFYTSLPLLGAEEPEFLAVFNAEHTPSDYIRIEYKGKKPATTADQFIDISVEEADTTEIWRTSSDLLHFTQSGSTRTYDGTFLSDVASNLTMGMSVLSINNNNNNNNNVSLTYSTTPTGGSGAVKEVMNSIYDLVAGLGPISSIRSSDGNITPRTKLIESLKQLLNEMKLNNNNNINK